MDALVDIILDLELSVNGFSFTKIEYLYPAAHLPVAEQSTKRRLQSVYGFVLTLLLVDFKRLVLRVSNNLLSDFHWLPRFLDKHWIQRRRLQSYTLRRSLR